MLAKTGEVTKSCVFLYEHYLTVYFVAYCSGSIFLVCDNTFKTICLVDNIYFTVSFRSLPAKPMYLTMRQL